MLSLLPLSRTQRQTFHPPQTRSPYAMSQSMNQLRWHVLSKWLALSRLLVQQHGSPFFFLLLYQLPTNIS